MQLLKWKTGYRVIGGHGRGSGADDERLGVGRSAGTLTARVGCSHRSKRPVAAPPARSHKLRSFIRRSIRSSAFRCP